MSDRALHLIPRDTRRRVIAIGCNDRAIERTRLQRELDEARRIHGQAKDHAWEIQVALAERALEKFERGGLK